VDQHATGQSTLFATLVEEHWEAVFRMLWCTTGNAHDAEELAQETFLRALRSFASFTPGTRARAWLLRIAMNACHDLRRRRKTRREAPLVDDAGPAAESTVAPLETAEQYERLLAAMQGLSETARAVFHLRAAESLSFREISRLLKISEESARWHMCQARKKLLKDMTRDE
jgi:RNA polymerase sigma factor (sigma-70 family)